MEIPVIKVGIMAGQEILVTLEGRFLPEDRSLVVNGLCKFGKSESGIHLESNGKSWIFGDYIRLTPVNPETARFVIHEVTIGLNFHWERKENEVFKGSLEFIHDDEKIHAVNVLSIEDYLLSVISSEMSATSSIEFLKAHAVISRSWLLAQTRKNKSLQNENHKYTTTFRTENELIRWYDREDHHLFDVCADDHCQRYQGITRATTPLIEQSVQKTCGEVLIYNGLICDARFSKCCGGITELFENAWEPVNHPYLQRVVDNDSYPKELYRDLTLEREAADWIGDRPEVFCNSSDKNVLKQILNDYDQETNDFFRWKVVYTQKELSELVKSRTGLDFGDIIDLIPVKRGVSGRIIKLKIVGSLQTMIIGKELEIRKSLSETHLYSSAFIIEKQGEDDAPQFILHGAGWGHGVGLCQIGAAVMGDKGYTYDKILAHYFPGAELKMMY